jgi:hypothetical protein
VRGAIGMRPRVGDLKLSWQSGSRGSAALIRTMISELYQVTNFLSNGGSMGEC